jgi:hypothetical protein
VPISPVPSLTTSFVSPLRWCPGNFFRMNMPRNAPAKMIANAIKDVNNGLMLDLYGSLILKGTWTDHEYARREELSAMLNHQYLEIIADQITFWRPNRRVDIRTQFRLLPTMQIRQMRLR